MFRSLSLVVLLGLVVAGCSDAPKPPGAAGPTSTAVTSAATPTKTPSTSSPAVDPYAVYLANRPKGEPKLSREDASTRALLGCGTKWPPGTVDAVLAEAYAQLCK